MKKIICLLVAVAIIFSLAGCSEKNDVSNEEVLPQINPVPENEGREKESVNLYFGYKSEQLLTYETRDIAVPINERIEVTICKNLIKGPSISKADFTAVINPNTKVVDISDNDGFLFVTLSKEFLMPPEESEESGPRENLRRYLAVYSVITTLIEHGGYDRVQILIDRDDSGTGTPITNAEVGLEGDEAFDPHGRNGAVVLNSRNTAREILLSIEMKDWSRLYGFVAYKNSEGKERPTTDDFNIQISTSKVNISDIEIVDHINSTSVYTDKVFVNYVIKIGDGEPQEKKNVPIKLVRENDVWKIYFEDLMSLMNGE